LPAQTRTVPGVADSSRNGGVVVTVRARRFCACVVTLMKAINTMAMTRLYPSRLGRNIRELLDC
jgi:hypothetical protein